MVTNSGFVEVCSFFGLLSPEPNREANNLEAGKRRKEKVLIKLLRAN